MDSTRIADLPENITMTNTTPFPPMDQSYGGRNGMGQGPQMPTYSPSLEMSNSMPPTNYVQMNVHPNPYGNGNIQTQINSIGLPQQTHTTKPSNNPYVLPGEQPPHLAHLPQHQLPSRDIPQDTGSYNHDPEITPNYIPPAKTTTEFVKEYEDAHARTIQEKKRQKRAIQSIDDVFLEIRIPLIVALLYMVFQSPVFHTLVFKKFSFLGIYSADGNTNMLGMMVKSAIFGAAYYGLDKIVEYVR